MKSQLRNFTSDNLLSFVIALEPIFMPAPATQRQPDLFAIEDMPLPISGGMKPFRTQLLKWVGNKQKQADAIIDHFPKQFGTYFEPRNLR